MGSVPVSKFETGWLAIDVHVEDHDHPESAGESDPGQKRG